MVFLCGHYEGIDERVIEEIVTDEISLGDFVLTGGELAAITIIDAVSRLVPGVLGKEESFADESFSEGLLEYPQYTRPPVFMGREVPEVLLSGHHGNVAKWRREQALIRTAKKTPRFAEKGGADETGHCIFAEAGHYRHYNRRNGIKKGAVIQFLFCIHSIYLLDIYLFILRMCI